MREKSTPESTDRPDELDRIDAEGAASAAGDPAPALADEIV
jgi:hypothetical protein